MTGAWIYGVIAALLLVHMVALRHAYRNAQQVAPGGDDEELVTEEGVECAECGEHNDHGYRFCRRCVSELPGGAARLDDTMTARNARIF